MGVVSPRMTVGMRPIKWFDEDENDINLILWALQSADFNPTEHLWEISEPCVKNSALHLHHQNTKIIWKDGVHPQSAYLHIKAGSEMA